MRSVWRLWLFSQHLFIILICTITICESSQKATKNVIITADDEKLRDPEGYAAIVQLHRQMDDDQSGSIDRFESNDFLKEDMQFAGSDREKREKAFHHNNDEQITVDDLWEAWFASEERTWTTAQLVNWLENSVRLPQYANNLIVNRVDGRALPRMAVANSSYLSMELGVKNAVHKHKMHLKALDVVLFGFSGGSSSRMKDIALSILLCILITVLVLYKRQRSRSHQEMEQLSSKLKQLKSMESDFEDVQQKFEEERKRRQSVSEAIVAENQQMETLRSQLLEAERLLESTCSAPLALQPLLRRTCELEMSYVGQQRLECIAEMREAIELIDKLRKKQSSLMSSIKLATGASSGTDQIDSRIFSLKARMEKISLAMEECQQRWIEIESLCGFPLMVQANGVEITFMGHGLNSSPNLAAATNIPRTPSVCSSSYFHNSGASSSTSATSTQSANSTIIGGGSSSSSNNPLPIQLQQLSNPSTTNQSHHIPPPYSSSYHNLAGSGNTIITTTATPTNTTAASAHPNNILASHITPHIIPPPPMSSSLSSISSVPISGLAHSSSSPVCDGVQADLHHHQQQLQPQLQSQHQYQHQHHQKDHKDHNTSSNNNHLVNDEIHFITATTPAPQISQVDPLLPFKREMRSRHSKGSLGSTTDSNEDDCCKQNGELKQPQTNNITTTTRKLTTISNGAKKSSKFSHFFRKNKHS